MSEAETAVTQNQRRPQILESGKCIEHFIPVAQSGVDQLRCWFNVFGMKNCEAVHFCHYKSLNF